MSIRVFVTGGTFDKEYDELRGTLEFRGTHVPEMLQRGRCGLDITVEVLLCADAAGRRVCRDEREVVPVARRAQEPRDRRVRGHDVSRGALRCIATVPGEPIWVTAERQQVRSAVSFWPGEEAPIGGLRPHWW